jgi:hypothetical protein
MTTKREGRKRQGKEEEHKGKEIEREIRTREKKGQGDEEH